uniref:Uncharacterized protein n=1 Tax=Rhizophora mucronata TaxID=61149 RepID=A0A2P2QXP9_RHIMU
MVADIEDGLIIIAFSPLFNFLFQILNFVIGG